LAFRVLDASAFYAGVPFASSGTLHTTSEVHAEVRHIKSSHGAIDALIDARRLVVADPSGEALGAARAAARSAGESGALSRADMSVIALCSELRGELVTDDYAVSNVAKRMGLAVVPVMTRGTRGTRRWVRRCSACSRAMGTEPACRVCGGAASRRPAR